MFRRVLVSSFVGMVGYGIGVMHTVSQSIVNPLIKCQPCILEIGYDRNKPNKGSIADLIRKNGKVSVYPKPFETPLWLQIAIKSTCGWWQDTRYEQAFKMAMEWPCNITMIHPKDNCPVVPYWSFAGPEQLHEDTAT